MNSTDLEFADLVKRRAIIAMFSDDELMDQLVLKGGNLLGIVYGISSRASVDVDFSIAGELGDVGKLRDRIEKTLTSTFKEIAYEVFDVTVLEVPRTVSPELKDFWGGYKVHFKIIEREKFLKFQGNLEQLQRNAASVGKRGSTKFSIDISKYEYCDAKQELTFEHLTIYGYSPAMVIAEKLRAICQQMPECVELTKSPASARARDFVDIHTVMSKCRISIDDPLVLDAIPKVFAAKKVPLHLLGKIDEYRDYHRSDFEAVKATVTPDFDLKDFDFYADFVVSNIKRLETLWNE